MYIWSHGFELQSPARLAHDPTCQSFYVNDVSNEGYTSTASVTGGYGTGWFVNGGNALFVDTPQPWYVAKEASRNPPWNRNGPSGEYGVRMFQPGQSVGPIDPTGMFRLNIEPNCTAWDLNFNPGGHDLTNVAVSFDCRFENGAVLARGKTDLGLLRFTTHFSTDTNEYPNSSNYTPCVVDVNPAGQVELWTLDRTSTNTLELDEVSTKSLPTGVWFRMAVHLYWSGALRRYYVKCYVNGELWVEANTRNDTSMPVDTIQGFRISYVIDRPDSSDQPDAAFQDIDNVVMFSNPTYEELAKNYYCIPIYSANNGDAHDVIRELGPAHSPGSWGTYDGSPGPAVTSFANAIDPSRNAGYRTAPEVAAKWQSGAGSDELVLRPQIPSLKWGNNYNPRQLNVFGVNAIEAFGMSTVSYGGSITAPKFQKPNPGIPTYFSYPGWMSGGQSRYQGFWPNTSTASFEFSGDLVSMCWNPSPYKQIAGSNWDGLNPSFANMTNFEEWSWVDDFEKGAIPFVMRAGNDGSYSTPWMTFAGLLEVCASWEHESGDWSKKPDAQLIIKDKLFDNDRSAKPYPTQTSPYPALPYAKTTNMGTLLPFMEGFWDTEGGQYRAGADLHYNISETGGLGYDATFAWRFDSETDSSLRGYMDQNMHWGHHNPFVNLGPSTPGFTGWRAQPYNETSAMSKVSAHCVGYSTIHNRLLVFWWNSLRKAYAIAYKNMSDEQRGSATPHSTAAYSYELFSGGYAGNEFPDNKLVGEDCPYAACVELIDGTLRFFHCYRDTSLPITDGFVGIVKPEFSSGYYNIDMYVSVDGGLTWELEKKRILDAPLGGSRIIRHMVAAADGDWMRLDMQFYDTQMQGDFFWQFGRMSIVSGDRGASWNSISTDAGQRPDGYDISYGNGTSNIYTSSGDPKWSIPKLTQRADETTSICGSGRGDGSFFRMRDTYNQRGVESGGYVNRYGRMTGWYVGGGSVDDSSWVEQITINVYERADRGDAWGLVDRPSSTEGRALDGIRSLGYGATTKYAVASPSTAYFGQVTVQYSGAAGIFVDGARWDGRFSFCVPSAAPFDYAKESGSSISAYKYQVEGSWYPAAKDIYDPTLEAYISGAIATAEDYFDPSGLARRGGFSWGMNEHSIDCVWASDRVVLSSALVANDKDDTWYPSGQPVPDSDVMPVCISFMGGWEKRPTRRLDGWSDYWKPQIWSRDWTAARGFPGIQTFPAVTAQTYLYPGRTAYTPTAGYPWTQNAMLGSLTSTLSAVMPSAKWYVSGPGTHLKNAWMASDSFASLSVGTTTQADTQLMAHGGVVDCCIVTEYGTGPYNLGNGPQRTEYDTVYSHYTPPQRGFAIETARNNSLTGGSTVYMGVSVNVISPASTSLSDQSVAYQGQISVYEDAYDAVFGEMYPARTMFYANYIAPTDSKRGNPYPINFRMALVDGYTLSPATTYTYIQCMFRENMSNDDWTVSGLLTMFGHTTVLSDQIIRFGQLGGGFGGMSYQNEWCHFRYGVGRESHMGVGFVDEKEAALGGLCSAFPMGVVQNTSVRWGGSGAFSGDTFTAPIKYNYGLDQIAFDSPQVHWRSGDTTSNEDLLYYAAKTETTDIEKYYRHNAIGLFNTNKRKIEVSYAGDTSFSSLTTTFTMDATRYADAIVTGVDKDIFAVENTSAKSWKQNELVGMYVELNKGANTYIKRVAKNWDNKIQLESLDASLTNYVDVWTTTSFYGDHSVHFMDGVPDGVVAKAMRVQFAPGIESGTGVPPEGFWKLGAMVPGMTFAFEVPLDWSDDDNEEGNVKVFTTPSGIKTAYKQGQPRRTYKGEIEGDIDRFRESLRATIRELAEYDKRPLVLVTDSANPNVQSMYCRWSGATNFKNEGWRYDSETLKWVRVGSIGVEFEEEI